MFLNLPVELQHECVQALDVETLKCLRLVNSTALALATKQLFGTVTLMPSDESAEKYMKIIEDEGLNPLVQRVIYNTSEDPESDEKEESDLLESCMDALQVIGKFGNLKEVEVRFARHCALASEDGWDNEVAETASFRTDVLEALLEGLENDENPASKVDCLTVKNLQDQTNPTIYDSAYFQSLLGKLQKLHLDITSEYDTASPENSIEMPGLHRGFNHDLPHRWLKPLQSQLTHLSIYCNTYWGFYPFCDLRGIYFPNLKSLSLGNWTIVHDWQIDWILSHGPTLEQLTLDDCPIATGLQMYEKQKALHWPDLPPLFENDAPEVFWKEIDLRWHHVLPRLQSGLPHLYLFSMGHGNWDESKQFEERYEFAPKILKSRYQMFDCGIGPSQWVEGDDHWLLPTDGQRAHEFDIGWNDGKLVSRPVLFPTCDVEDFNALVGLMEIVKKRGRAKV